MAELDEEILQRFPRGLPLVHTLTYGTTTKLDTLQVHRRLVSVLAKRAQHLATPRARLLQVYRSAFQFVQLWLERNEASMCRSAWVVLKLGFRPISLPSHGFCGHIPRRESHDDLRTDDRVVSVAPILHTPCSLALDSSGGTESGGNAYGRIQWIQDEFRLTRVLVLFKITALRVNLHKLICAWRQLSTLLSPRDSQATQVYVSQELLRDTFTHGHEHHYKPTPHDNWTGQRIQDLQGKFRVSRLTMVIRVTFSIAKLNRLARAWNILALNDLPATTQATQEYDSQPVLGDAFTHVDEFDYSYCSPESTTRDNWSTRRTM